MMAALLRRLALCAGLVLSLAARQQPPVTFRSGTDVVLVPVWVKDGDRTVTGLTAADFVLTDNGVPQDVTTVATESQPMDVTLTLDVSGSLRGAAFEALKAAVQQIGRTLRPDDRLRLVTFASGIMDVFGLQPGGRDLPLDRITAGGPTSLYDALGAVLMSVEPSGRPHLLFAVSDGIDTSSFLDARQVVALAGPSDACLYVAVVRGGPSGEPGSGISQAAGAVPRTVMRAVEHLEAAAVRTGGLLFEHPPETTLAALFEQAAADFRAGYLLSYTPQGVERQGWHELTVHTRNPQHVVRARRAYQR